MPQTPRMEQLVIDTLPEGTFVCVSGGVIRDPAKITALKEQVLAGICRFVSTKSTFLRKNMICFQSWNS